MAVRHLESVYPNIEESLSRCCSEASTDEGMLLLSRNLCRWIETSANSGISSAVVRAVWWSSRSRGNSNDLLLSPHVMKALARQGDDEAIWALLGLYFGSHCSVVLGSDTRVVVFLSSSPLGIPIAVTSLDSKDTPGRRTAIHTAMSGPS